MKSHEVLESLSEKWANQIPGGVLEGQEAIDSQSISILSQMAEKMENNYPYASPLYAGQMLKPPHVIARTAYAFAQQINPNNHALDGGRESSSMEIEAVAEIARMFGWNEHLGHLAGGGTMANLEALWVAGSIHPNKKVVASQAAHYTHERITSVLKIPYASIPNRIDKPVLDTLELESMLKEGNIGTVVVTAGTTGTGHVEPVDEVIRLAKKYGARVHVDAAYGGYFRLVVFDKPSIQSAFDAITEADSIVIDPHKHGLQPYGCGCVLFKDPSVGKFYLHDSPYTYFTSEELHLGEITLECSRPGAAAVALWATQKRFPLNVGGEMSDGLKRCIDAANALHSGLESTGNWLLPFEPDLDILVYAPRANSISEISKLSEEIFDAAAKLDLHLALYKMDARYIVDDQMERDSEIVTCLRSTLMKWSHKDYIPEIQRLLEQSRVQNS
ncbi:pyridoxal phosphate-dependent decarboxylase family protein [Phaeocystidibacter luteus]|nr:aminotransferase class V-fold PLP-dependent enzyme [Phaeocystidibacter luteus]